MSRNDDEGTTQISYTGPIQHQLLDSCPPSSGQANNLSEVLVPHEVVEPMVPSRVKERCVFACHGVYGHDVRVFPAIASRTSEREVGRVIGTTVGTRDNVLNRERVG